MRFILFRTLLLFVFCFSVVACQSDQPANSTPIPPTNQPEPTADSTVVECPPSTADEIAILGELPESADTIPTTLDESFIALDTLLTSEQKEAFRCLNEEDIVVATHFGLGMWLRNNWHLWQKSSLADNLIEQGLFHPDDMSSLVLTSYHRKLNGRDIEVDVQIAKMLEFWQTQTLDEDGEQ